MFNLFLKCHDVTVSVSNGTNESSTNQHSKFECALNINPSVGVLNPFSVSFITSDDEGEVGSFGTQLTGWMLDAHVDITDRLSLFSYYTQLTYDDGQANTDDDVTSALLELSYRTVDYQVSLRMDTYDRADSGTINNDIPSSFFSQASFSSANDITSIQAYSLGLNIFLEDGVTLKSHVFAETAESKQYAVGVLSYINVFF